MMERDVEQGLWGRDKGGGTVMERDVEQGLWGRDKGGGGDCDGKRCGTGTVGKG